LIKKLTKYAVECYKEYDEDPVVAVVNTGTTTPDAASDFRSSNLEGCIEYPCRSWARKCYLFSPERVNNNQTAAYTPITTVLLYITNPENVSTDGTLFTRLKQLADTFNRLYQNNHDEFKGKAIGIYEKYDRTLFEICLDV
jgi:hypothetical protein